MQPGEEHVHANECEQYAHDAHQGIDRHAPPLPLFLQPQVEVSRVDQPGDQRPGLLWIPGPEGAPGLLGPNGSGKDRDRVERKI